MKNTNIDQTLPEKMLSAIASQIQRTESRNKAER